MGVRVQRHDGAPVLAPLALAVVAAAGLLRVGALPSVELPMPTFRWGLVTPTCGLVRATEALLAGDVTGAVAFNPAVLVLAVAAFVLVGRTALGLGAGRWLNLTRAPRHGAVLVVVLLAMVALGAHQQSRADLVMGDAAPATVPAVGWCPLGG